MKYDKFFSSDRWTREHIAGWITVSLALVNIGLGNTIIVGGVPRFPLPSYSTLLDYSGGRPWMWGLIIIFAGILMSLPFRWLNIVGLWISMTWHMTWMAAFMIAVIHYPDAAATPIEAYGGFALISAALLTSRIIDKEPDKERT